MTRSIDSTPTHVHVTSSIHLDKPLKHTAFSSGGGDGCEHFDNEVGLFQNKYLSVGHARDVSQNIKGLDPVV